MKFCLLGRHVVLRATSSFSQTGFDDPLMHLLDLNIRFEGSAK